MHTHVHTHTHTHTLPSKRTRTQERPATRAQLWQLIMQSAYDERTRTHPHKHTHTHTHTQTHTHTHTHTHTQYTRAHTYTHAHTRTHTHTHAHTIHTNTVTQEMLHLGEVHQRRRSTVRFQEGVTSSQSETLPRRKKSAPLPLAPYSDAKAADAAAPHPPIHRHTSANIGSNDEADTSANIGSYDEADERTSPHLYARPPAHLNSYSSQSMRMLQRHSRLSGRARSGSNSSVLGACLCVCVWVRECVCS